MTVFELLQILQRLEPDQQLDVDFISDEDGFSQVYPLDGVRDGKLIVDLRSTFEIDNKGKL